MSQGKPILAMINGDGADLVHEAECGMTVAAGKSKELSEVIRKLSTMENEELSILGMNGLTYYKRNFDKELRMNQIVSLLMED